SCHRSPRTEHYSPSLHDALPISSATVAVKTLSKPAFFNAVLKLAAVDVALAAASAPAPVSKLTATPLIFRLFVSPAVATEMPPRSEEHTSELQSREKLVCRLLLE